MHTWITIPRFLLVICTDFGVRLINLTWVKIMLMVNWALGSVMSPLVCQSLLSRHISWRNFYLGSLSLAALNMTAIFFVYRPTLTEFEVDRSAPPTELPINVQFSRSSTYQSGKEKSKSVWFDQASERCSPLSLPIDLQKTLRSRRVWAFSVFQALYVGRYVHWRQGPFVSPAQNKLRSFSETVTQGFVSGVYILQNKSKLVHRNI